MTHKTPIKKALASSFGAAFLASSIVPAALAGANPFSAVSMDRGYEVVSHGARSPDKDKDDEGSCGEGSCGEGKADKGEGSCGEGSCGEGKAKKGEGSCGEGKAKKGEGSCGEGKCGG
jgi:uncharacterized low-complexity protein